MNKKHRTSVERAKQIRELLEKNKGKCFSLQFISKTIHSDQRRISKLIEIAEILRSVETITFDGGKKVLYTIPQGEPKK